MYGLQYISVDSVALDTNVDSGINHVSEIDWVFTQWLPRNWDERPQICELVSENHISKDKKK